MTADRSRDLLWSLKYNLEALQAVLDAQEEAEEEVQIVP